MAGRPREGQEKDRNEMMSMRINRDLKTRLRREARDRAKPVSDVIHDALRLYFKTHHGENHDDTPA